LTTEFGYKFKLKLLLQVTQAINNNYTRAQLLRIYEVILRNQDHVKKYVLYSNSDKGLKPESFAGITPEEIMDFDADRYHEQLSYSNEIKFLPDTGLFFNTIIPAHHKETMMAILFLQSEYDLSNEDNLTETTKSDLEFLQTLTNIVFVALENKILVKERLKQETLRKELEMAAELQSMLFPLPWNKKMNLDIAAFHNTYEQVGGDYYDYFELNDEEVAFCIADVSGKGISAALLMSNFQANVRALFPTTPDLAELTRRLNEKVDRAAKGEKFITAFLARYNVRTRVFSYVNAGHNPPLLLSKNQIETLTLGAPGLGMIHELPSVKQGDVTIQTGDLLVCYTDGVTELKNSKGYFFGTEGLKDVIEENGMLTPEELNLTIILKLERFKEEESDFSDDIALLTTRFI
jgi:sigma-B regulation protein RsbU (phosphoserine phosphatase)